jgi:cold shock CspA family protein
MTETDALDIPLEIAFQQMERSEHIEHQVRRQARKLERFRNTLIDARVVVEAAHKGSQSTDMEVKVEVSVPGTMIVGTAHGRPHLAVDNADAYGFIHQAFDHAVRQLDAYIDKHHHPTKAPAGRRRQGKVTRLDPERGTGILETETGQSLFFQDSAVEGEALSALAVGMTVTYTVAEAEGAYGPEAATVTRVVGGRI